MKQGLIIVDEEERSLSWHLRKTWLNIKFDIALSVCKARLVGSPQGAKAENTPRGNARFTHDLHTPG